MLARNEHRRSPRIPKMLDASIERTALVQVEGQNRVVPALICDVSREGIGFAALEPFDVDSPVRVNIELTKEGLGSRRLIIPAIVRHCTPVRNRGFKVGLLIRKELAGHGMTVWMELVQRWSTTLH